MSTKSKIVFLCAFLSLVATFALQIMTGMWLNLNSALLGLSGGLVVLAVLLDWPLYWEFLTMRTTKHGMNMGALIVMVITLLVCLNYLANKHNKTWDVTREHANTLSEQSEKVVGALKDDLHINVFYKGPSAQEEKARVKTALQLFQDASSKIKVRFINAYVDQQEAIHDLTDQPDRDTAPLIALVQYGDKKVRIDESFDEAAITSALIKASREGEAKVYFIKGHGEREIDNDSDQGLKDFAKALGEASFKTEGLSLIDKKEIPADASVVAIIGPSVPFLDSEMEWVRDYVRKGGRLFIALDPGQRQNLANLTKPLGIEFENNYVMTLAPIVGGGPATVIGRSFDPSSEITRSIPNGASAVFPLASEVRVAPDKIPGIEAHEIVSSDPASFTITDISRPLTAKPSTKAIPLAVDSRGTLPASDKKDAPASKAFEAVVFGDSDFVSNRVLALGANRDLALNVIAQLANQQDLLSIRPKLPSGTMIVLTTFNKWMVVLCGLALPVLLLISSGVMWFRRRGA